MLIIIITTSTILIYTAHILHNYLAVKIKEFSVLCIIIMQLPPNVPEKESTYKVTPNVLFPSNLESEGIPKGLSGRDIVYERHSPPNVLLYLVCYSACNGIQLEPYLVM